MSFEGEKKAASLMNNASHESKQQAMYSYVFLVVSNGWQLCRSEFMNSPVGEAGDGTNVAKLLIERHNTSTARTRLSFKTTGWLPR